MEIIDRYAYANRLRPLDPAYKAGLALSVIAFCLLGDRPAVGVAAVGWMWLLATFGADLPGRFFGRLLLAEGLFFCLAAVGIAISASVTAPVGAGGWQIGPLWLGSSRESLVAAVLVVTRALGGAAAMNFLALTTPLVDLIALLQRLRVPPLLIDLVSLIYRFIFVLAESARRTRTAQAGRLGYDGYRRSLVSLGLLAGHLFADALRRSRRLNMALASRGYEGELRSLSLSYRHQPLFLLWSAAVIGTLLVLGRGL